jgi:hypothetical protein
MQSAKVARPAPGRRGDEKLQGQSVAQWQGWRPPEVDQPTLWQMAQVARLRQGGLRLLVGRLREQLGQEVLALEALVTTEREAGLVGAAQGCEFSLALAEALVAAALGLASPQGVRLSDPAERALLDEVAAELRAWAGPEPAPGQPAVWLGARLTCLGVQGAALAYTAWPALCSEVRQQPRPPGLRLPAVARALRLRVTATLPGPLLSVGELASLQPGQVLLLPAAAAKEVSLHAGAVQVARGRLGAVQQRLAVRVEQIAEESGSP